MDFLVQTVDNCVEGFTMCLTEKPGLVILNKTFPAMGSKGFMIKKSNNTATVEIPVFIIGEFGSDEILNLKKMNVVAFMSSPINPVILVERISLLFSLPPRPFSKRTPMLLDMHVRGNVIIAQIEGNFEEDKLEEFNYLVRAFCRDNSITSPRILIIIPSLYKESITKENIDLLFRFLHYPELEIKDFQIKLLTALPALISILKKNARYAEFEVVKDFVSGFQSLQIDFDKKKTVPTDFLKTGCIYIFDLYDNQGRKVVPALTPLTEPLLQKINEQGLGSLTYYSDFDFDEIEREVEDLILLQDEKQIYSIFAENFEPIKAEVDISKIWDEKLSLFFRGMKGQNVLIVSGNRDVYDIILRSLNIYFNIEKKENGADLGAMVKQKSYIIVFLDGELSDEQVISMLRDIRAAVSRRKTSVIILANKLNKSSVIQFRNAGTDNIIVSPFSTNKILHKVFESVTLDRRT
jgi:response regulator RpfG family c-di-GMP phosphodiesterase